LCPADVKDVQVTSEIDYSTRDAGGCSPGRDTKQGRRPSLLPVEGD
jgi:hypothetical protein